MVLRVSCRSKHSQGPLIIAGLVWTVEIQLGILRIATFLQKSKLVLYSAQTTVSNMEDLVQRKWSFVAVSCTRRIDKANGAEWCCICNVFFGPTSTDFAN